MSILDRLRSGTDSTPMQLILGAVLLSFLGFYGQQNSGKGEIGPAATVNGTIIPGMAFARLYDNAERQSPGASEEDKAGIKKMVTDYLVRNEVLRQEAVRLGIAVSAEEVTRAIAFSPGFADENGVFDEKVYVDRLRRIGISRADFEVSRHDELLIQKLLGLIWKGVDISDADVKQAYIREEATLNVKSVRIAPLRFNDDVDLSTEAVNTFISENGPRIKELYDADFERLYNVPEKLRLSVIRLPVREDGVTLDQLTARIDAAKAQIEGGAKFADVARRLSEHPTAADGGAMEPAAVSELESTVADAVGKLEIGQLAVVKGDKEIRLFTLDERIAAHVIPIEETQNDIARQLMREEQAPKLAIAFAEKLLATWRDTGELPQADLDAQGIAAQETGEVPPSQLAQGTQAGPPIAALTEAVDAKVGPLSKVFEDKGSYWVVGVTARTEADMSAFDAKKEEIRDQVLLQRRAQFLDAYADGLIASAKVVPGQIQ